MTNDITEDELDTIAQIASASGASNLAVRTLARAVLAQRKEIAALRSTLGALTAPAVDPEPIKAHGKARA